MTDVVRPRVDVFGGLSRDSASGFVDALSSAGLSPGMIFVIVLTGLFLMAAVFLTLRRAEICCCRVRNPAAPLQACQNNFQNQPVLVPQSIVNPSYVPVV
jgi:hypothetical protein